MGGEEEEGEEREREKERGGRGIAEILHLPQKKPGE